MLAYILGRRKDEVFLDLKAMTNHLGLHDSTPMVGEHMSVIKTADKHEVGKQHMQKIESKHTNLRARIKRLARKTICFSLDRVDA